MSQSIIVNVPVQSVNGETGAVALTASEVGAAETVHTHVESDITNLGSYLTDANQDSEIYGRQDGAWVIVPTSDGVEEASVNGLPYLRKDESWVQPKITSSGISTTGVGIQIEDASAANSYTIPSSTTLLAGVMSATDKTKLDGIATGAEVNVQSDWNATSGDSVILNKPTTIPSGGTSGQVLSKDSGTDYDVSWQTPVSSGSVYTAQLELPQSFSVPAGYTVLNVSKTFNGLTAGRDDYYIDIVPSAADIAKYNAKFDFKVTYQCLTDVGSDLEVELAFINDGSTVTADAGELFNLIVIPV